MSDDAFVRLDSTNARWRMVGDSVVVMDLKNSMYFCVEGSVTAVWPRLEQGVRVRELAADLAAEFEADQVQIFADIAGIIEDLAARGVAVIQPTA